jgi:hypothetical protein
MSARVIAHISPEGIVRFDTGGKPLTYTPLSK